jgi:hypothetical protein
MRSVDGALDSDGFCVPEGVIDSDLIALQDAWNEARFRDIRYREAREAYSRKLLQRRLPRVLLGLIDHPHLLKPLLRLVSRWRPIMTVVAIRPKKDRRLTTMTAEAAQHFGQAWLQEQEARGRDVSGGYVFTYTDVNQLPAEVYGP